MRYKRLHKKELFNVIFQITAFQSRTTQNPELPAQEGYEKHIGQFFYILLQLFQNVV